MLAALIGATIITGCGSSGGSDGSAATSTTAGGSTGASTTAPEGTTTASSSTTGASTTTTTAAGLPGASLNEQSAPEEGAGQALLTDVRIGTHSGYERIVFEFEGTTVPGYRVGWADGPITADGSGEVVDVKGDAALEIVMQPASGVDLSSSEPDITYDGPGRIPTAGRTTTITDLVRTGDFEAVLSWAAGATERVPFRVSTLRSPTRVVIDLATSS